MAPHNTGPQGLATETDGYFTGPYGQTPSPRYEPDEENFADPAEIPMDVRPTPDSHRRLLSDSGLRTEKSGGIRSEIPRWRPTWLRPIVLLTFLALFVLLAVVLPVMLWYSQNHNGLFQTRASLVYLWRFGPTAILTVMLSLWARVEFQATRYMPWIAERRARELGKDVDVYDLDYTAMMSPVVLFQSLKRGHYFVFLAAVATLILKIQIVLAPSLYSLATFRITEEVRVQLLDSFNTTAPPQQYTDGSAYYMARALDNFDMRFPFGVTKDLSYQTFKFGNGTARGSTGAPLTVVVDGYFSKMECLKMESYTASEPTVTNLNYYTFDVDLTFPGCDARVPVVSNRIMWNKNKTERGETAGNWVVNMTVGMPCPNLPRQNNQSLYYAARFGPSAKNSSRPAFLDVAAVLCTSTDWVSKVEVVDDGVNPIATVLNDQVKTPVNSDLWTMLNWAMPEAGGLWGSSATGSVAGPVASLARFRGESLGTGLNVSDPKLYTNEILEHAVMATSQALGPLLGHYRLRADNESQPVTTGSTIKTIDRLVVNQWVCLSMAALFALLGVMVTFILLRYTARTAIWHRDPASILGNMIYFKEHPDVLSRAAYSTISTENGSTDWSRSGFTPLVLRGWARGMFAILTIAVIVGLSYALKVSEASGGLATVSDEGYLHLLWTSFPALVMLGIAVYASCCAFVHKELATLSCLSSRPCSARELDLSLLDMLGFRSLYHSVRQRTWAVTLSQLLSIICAFLTTLVSVIFTVEHIPDSKTIQLRQETWFGSTAIAGGLDDLSVSRANRQLISSLVSRQGEAALAYPRNTYDDLVFPVLGGVEGVAAPENTTITVTVPAAKLHPVTCFQVPTADYIIDINNWTEETTYYKADITQSISCPNGSRGEIFATMDMGSATHRLGRSYVAEILPSPQNLISVSGACRLGLNASAYEYASWRFQTYAWGEYSKENNEFKHFSMWRCNYTWVETATEVHLTANQGNYILDPERPPRPNLSTTKPWSPALDVPHVDNEFSGRGIYSAFPSLTLANPLTGFMDDQFKALIEPFGQLPLEAIGDPARNDEILQGLQHNYGLVAAQLANIENRYNLTESSMDRPPPADGLPTLEATLTDNSRRRLVQNPQVTYILVGILGVVALANIWALVSAACRPLVGGSWLFDMDVKGLAPDGFHSMAAMSALLRGSNAPDYLPESTELLSSDELHGQISYLRFRLGWFRRAPDQERLFTIGVAGTSDFQYLGSRTPEVDDGETHE
ncbi:uncharacterized protein LY79DRAFT_600664 [Colletotrichum navitas]|uniref:Uncharacterized protein n=1 Tax=Colletotrichum navitas TaxID=681940 RepID=A0AAD8Q7A6_9PEZI|nr:uncharacterized protein LY79DRAFT_600664 [Colletotrichum navitas]KAK1597248.1 hypothetical protein LY79DRAFT_600664 [Colletotrichum navitas]